MFYIVLLPWIKLQVDAKSLVWNSLSLNSVLHLGKHGLWAISLSFNDCSSNSGIACSVHVCVQGAKFGCLSYSFKTLIRDSRIEQTFLCVILTPPTHDAAQNPALKRTSINICYD